MLPNPRKFCKVFFFLGFQALNPSLPTSILSRLLQPSNLLFFELQEVRARLEVDPPRTWYYYIPPNSCTLVILLQINLVFNDEPETVCEGCYKTENTSIFTWSLIPDIGYYHWLRGSICQLPPNSKTYYLVRTIRRILNFLQL
jgi:hypothetical protein